MRSSDPTSWNDGLAVSLRWLILLAVAAGATAPLPRPVLLTLFSAALWNLALTLLAALGKRFRALAAVQVLVDLAIAASLFYFSGLLSGGLGWVGLLPLLTAALFYQLRGALVVTLLNLLVAGSLAWLAAPRQVVYAFVLTLIPLYLGVGVVVGYLSQRLVGARPQPAKVRQEAQPEVDRQRSRVLSDLISSMSASLNYQRVLEAALDAGSLAISGPQAGSDCLVSAVLLFSTVEKDETVLTVGSARHFPPADLRLSLPGKSGIIAAAIDEGEGRLTRDVAQDPELGRIIALHSCLSAYCIPLRSGLDAYGVLLFAHPQADFFGSYQREVLDIVGHQAAIAMQNASLYRELEKEKERIMEIQEEARKKMARDLHDGPTQSLAAIAMRVNFARRLMDRDAKTAAEELFKIEELARRTTKEIRHMLFTLRPLVLESQGLIAALKSMAEKMHDTYDQNVIIQAEPKIVVDLEPGKQSIAFYIAEEAVTNARKHAGAAHIWVRLKSVQEDLALLEVEDDGRGFNPGAVDAVYENRTSLGMVNMRERAELVNGVFRLNSAEGQGTRIQVFIPLSEEAADRIRRGR